MNIKNPLRSRLAHQAALAAALTCSLATAVHAADLAEGFTSIFDGKTLDGWKYYGNKGGEYFVTNETIVCPEASQGNLLTDKEYSDFVLRFEFKLWGNGNNGVAVRVPPGATDLTYVGVEVQLLDDSAPMHKDIKPWQHNGSVYGLIPSHDSQPNLGEWNTEELSCIGRHYKVVLNGKVIVDGDINDVTDSKLIQAHPGMFREKGHIGFLGHDSRFEFRNILVKEVTMEAKDNVAPKGFVAVFNGEDLSGWKGLVADPPKRAKMSPEELAAEQMKADQRMRDHWRAVNGEIVFDGKGDSLCTKKDYGDFEMLVDWKIPPKGDSGIYLRGSPQVQIWEPHSPGQFNPVDGSGGLYNNEKNPRHPLKFADKPVGEWNHFRIIMTGEKVHVFLNGELVVRDTTMENYWERSKPIYPTGQLELQNHGGQLWFKNIFVREIPRQ